MHYKKKTNCEKPFNDFQLMCKPPREEEEEEREEDEAEPGLKGTTKHKLTTA